MEVERESSMRALEKYKEWINNIDIDEATRQELKALEGDENEIYDRFSKQLEFGTGGLRGLIGAGTNRMNVYTVRLATQAFAEFLKKRNINKGVAIASDPRNMSAEFVREAAAVLIGNNIPVHVFQEFVPTPFLSFAVRYCQADGGIMITASHNTKEYNGFKAYNKDGVQLLPEEAMEVSEIARDLSLADVKCIANPQNSPLWNWVKGDLYTDYFDKLAQLAPENSKQDLSIRVLFTALHGTGSYFVPRALQNAGFTKVDCVEEQCIMDGNFPTVAVPNPEEPEAFTLAFNQAAEGDYDLILATDPDCDRVGVAVFSDERFLLLTGNQVGILLADYLLQQLAPSEGHNKIIIKTIVSTEMIKPMAQKYGVEVLETLTGFKFIGAKIDEIEKQGKEFLFGFEESCGYLAGSFVRDKDGVMTSLLIAQMVAFYKRGGLTLAERLYELMEEYGHHLDHLQNYYFENLLESEGAEKFIHHLRREPFETIGGISVKCFKDYLKGVIRNFEDGSRKDFLFPRENVLQWETVAGDLITLRPSGTEPKMKLYISIVAKHLESAERKLAKLRNALDRIINDGLKQVAGG